MPIEVTDIRSNPQDQIAHAARVINRSVRCRKVFSAIYEGKKKIKTVEEIARMTALSRMAVLQEAGKLSNNGIVKKTRFEKDTAYEKDPFYTQNKKTILRLAGNRIALEKFPTKTNPKIGDVPTPLYFPKKMIDAQHITIDEIDSFASTRSVTAVREPAPIAEEAFKEGLQKVLQEEGAFQDWGGETDDLFSTRLVIKGQRMTAAFGLKGKATKGILTPKKMGERGDQIQRLFRAPAEVFLVQYWGQIDESVIEQMKYFAAGKSVYEQKRIYYGVIDGRDTLRILAAYSEFFHLMTA